MLKRLFSSQRHMVFIDRKQQIRYIFEVGMHALLFPIVFYLLVTVPPFSKWIHGADQAVLRELYLNGLKAWVQLWWVALIALVIVGYFSVLTSHKLFGPIRRLRSVLDRTRQGEKVPSIVLRKGDYFVEFAAELESYLKEQEPPSAQSSDKKAGQ